MPEFLMQAGRDAENEIARVVMQAVAHAYHLADDEDETYVAYSKLFNRARNLEKDLVKDELIGDLIAARVNAVRDLLALPGEVGVAPGRAPLETFVSIATGDAISARDQVEGLSRS